VTFWVADSYLLAKITFESKVLDIAGMPRFHKFSDKYCRTKEHFYSSPEMSGQYLWHRKNSEVVLKRDLSSVRSDICTILVTPQDITSPIVTAANMSIQSDVSHARPPLKKASFIVV